MKKNKKQDRYGEKYCRCGRPLRQIPQKGGTLAKGCPKCGPKNGQSKAL